MKLKLMSAVGIAMLTCSTLAFAENPNLGSRGAGTPNRGNMDRPIARVTVNIAKNPQSRGLPNALVHLLENQRKHAEHQAELVERPERPERPERALPPGIADRPAALARVSDRPLPPGLSRLERPLPPGHTRR